MLAEQNMALAEETRALKRDVEYIKEALKPKAPSTKFNCQKCNKLSSSPTRIQEHIQEDHCCKYCEKTFSSRIEKERHKTYMCMLCRKTFGHNLELHIHTKTFHRQENESQKPARKKENVSEVARQKQPDLPFKCTECKYQQENGEELIKHIETKHASILSPAKVIKPIPAPRKKEIKETSEDDVIRHMERGHHSKVSKDICDVPPTKETSKSYDCRKCGHKEKTSETLANHLKVKHTNYMNLPNWFIVGDSHLSSIKPRMVEKAGGGKLFGKGFNHPKANLH